ncbi:MAG TPA: hypothetical protein VEQ60_03880, partial [Longimicrobium sp.]|nr:hypothetical protein [Longimicrobium sp.]
MIPKTSPLHAVYQLLRKKQYRQAVALANFYPRSDERRTLELLALLQLGGMDDAAAVVPEKAEELPALALQLRELSVELGLRWEMLPVPARAGENSYLKYLCLDLIGTFRSDTASTAGYALRTLARRGIQDRNWLFARICLQRALEVDQSPLGLVEAAKLVNGITRKGEDGDRWQGQPALELVQEALARATPENSTADLFPDAAFLLLTLDPAAEERAAEVVRRAAGWFPQQRRVILAGCVRRAREARDDNPDLAARMDMLGTELIDSLVEYLSERSGHLAGQLGILQEERHVYRTAAWYREGQERVAVLLLLERATDADLSARLHHLMNLKAYPTEWRADWLVYALSRPVALSDDERDEVLRWAETLPPKSRLALLRVLRQHPGSGRLGQRPSETTIHVSGEQNLVLSSGRDVVFSIDSSFSSLNA